MGPLDRRSLRRSCTGTFTSVASSTWSLSAWPEFSLSSPTWSWATRRNETRYQPGRETSRRAIAGLNHPLQG